MLSILTALLGGCSKQHSDVSIAGTKVSGDLVPVVMQSVTSRGGHAGTNSLPAIQANWTQQTRESQDAIIVEGDHFAEVQKALELAYGVPDPGLGSSAVASVGADRTLTYSSKQIGVEVNLSTDSKQTTVSVMGSPPPNAQ